MNSCSCLFQCGTEESFVPNKVVTNKKRQKQTDLVKPSIKTLKEVASKSRDMGDGLHEVIDAFLADKENSGGNNLVWHKSCLRMNSHNYMTLPTKRKWKSTKG